MKMMENKRRMVNSNIPPQVEQENTTAEEFSYDEYEEEQQVFNIENTDIDYLSLCPPGFKFTPTDGELVHYYLEKKVKKEKVPYNRFNVVNLYDSDPQTLAGKFRKYGGYWYFFTPRNRKYKNGQRPNRAAGYGYWKPTGADKPVKFNKVVVGSRKSLVYYEGKSTKGVKTDWLMHEFCVSSPPNRIRKDANDMKLDDWVLCRIYKKPKKSSKKRKPGQDDTPSPNSVLISSPHVTRLAENPNGSGDIIANDWDEDLMVDSDWDILAQILNSD